MPSNHVYVRHLSPPDDKIAADVPTVRRLPDPDPSDPTRSTLERWWPPVMLEPDWVRNSNNHDVFHLQFGFDARTPEELTGLVDSLRRRGTPLVYTVHDLRNPHHLDSSLHNAALDVLIPAADALITLTPGAAAEIERRWGRRALVMPHPALLAAPTVDHGTMPRSDGFRVGVHLKDLRSNVAAETTVAALAAALELLAATGVDATAEVRMHRSARDSPLRERVRELCAASDRLELVEHERLDDTALAEALAALDACVLPYGHGTHSGWLELCWDLAVPVAVPEVGFYSEQHADGSIAAFVPDPDGASLASALRALLESEAATRSATGDRAAAMVRRRVQRIRVDDGVAAAHAALYRRLVDARRA